MSETAELTKVLRGKRYRRWFLTAVVTFVAVYLLLFKFVEVRLLLNLLDRINPLFFGIAILLQVATFVLLAALFNELLRIFDHQLKLSFLVKHSLILNFLNRTVPTGGISGGTSFVTALTRKGISGAQAGLVTIAAYILHNAAYLILLLVGYAGLFMRAELGIGAVRFTTLLIGAIILVVWTIIIIFGDKERFGKRSFALVSALNSMLRPILRRTVIKDSAAKEFIKALYEGMGSLFRKKKKLLLASIISIFQHAAQIATLYVIFLGFGHGASLAVLTVGYVLANFFALAAFFISGLGVYEASMVTVLVGLGTPFEVTLASVLVYRLLSFFAPLPVGFYFYRRG